MTNLQRLKRGFSTSYTPWKPNLNSFRRNLTIYILLREEYSNFTGGWACTCCCHQPGECPGKEPTKHNPTFLFCHQSLWISGSWVQRLHSGYLTTWTIWFPVVSPISLTSHIFMLKHFYYYLQGRTGNSNAISGWDGLHDRMIFQIFTAADIKLIIATFQLRQGNCNIYFQYAVCHFPLQVNLAPLSLFFLMPFQWVTHVMWNLCLTPEFCCTGALGSIYKTKT